VLGVSGLIATTDLAWADHYRPHYNRYYRPSIGFYIDPWPAQYRDYYFYPQNRILFSAPLYLSPVSSVVVPTITIDNEVVISDAPLNQIKVKLNYNPKDKTIRWHRKLL